MYHKGKFLPVGGTWVEMDCNVPSGESLVRQFLYGQTFFEKEFGRPCSEFWLPGKVFTSVFLAVTHFLPHKDTFGYAAQLPQIMKLAEVSYFLTQKLSWCQFNKFPHHTFYWQGLDQSRVLTHFPPTDTYNAQLNISDTFFHLKNFKEHERSNHSLMLFGNGDGGGGPTEQMLENAQLLRNCDGLPILDDLKPVGFNSAHKEKDSKNKKSHKKQETQIVHGVESFYTIAENTSEDLAVWVGELYFELHRGTYTSQAKHKLGNRQSEILLGDLEKLCSWTSVNFPDYKYPFETIEELWKLLLLNQFHDALPGSSINECYVVNIVLNLPHKGDFESNLEFLTGFR